MLVVVLVLAGGPALPTASWGADVWPCPWEGRAAREEPPWVVGAAALPLGRPVKVSDPAPIRRVSG